MAVAIVQTATPADQAGSGAMTATFASAPTDGNKIIMAWIVSWSTTTAATPAAGFTESTAMIGTGTPRLQVWHKEASGDGTGVASVTNPGGTATLWAWEVSGLDDSDVVGTLVADTDTYIPGSTQTTAPLDLVEDSPLADMFCVAVLSTAASITGGETASNGFGGIQTSSAKFGFAATRVDSTVVAPSTTLGWTTGRFPVSALISFKGASTAGPHWARLDETLTPVSGQWRKLDGSLTPIAGSLIGV